MSRSGSSSPGEPVGEKDSPKPEGVDQTAAPVIVTGDDTKPNTASPTTGVSPSGSPKVEVPNLPDATDVRHPVTPFKYNWSQHSGPCQLLKMIIVGLFLFVPRFIIFLISFFMLWLTSALMLCCTTWDGLHEAPLKRPIGRFFLRMWSRIILFCLGYVWISVDRKKKSGGKDGVPEAPIIVANHVSFLDPFYFAFADIPMAVGKAELSKAPIVGSITKATQTIYVARESSKARHNVAEEINKRTRWTVDQDAETLKQHPKWPPLLIFPEATCTNSTSVIQFKAGAFFPMMPVQPVVLDYKQNHLDVSWVGGMGVGITFIRMMCQVYNRLHVTYLPVEKPAEDPHTFAENTRARIAAQMGVPLTNHNFLDTLLLRECHMLRLPMDTANIEMGKYNIGLDEAKKQLREFKKLDKNGDGCLDREEFAQFLGLQSGEDMEGGEHHSASMVDALLSKWDVDNDGKINFREFLFFGAMLKARHLARTASLLSEGIAGISSGDAAKDKDKQELLHAFTLCFGSFDLNGDGQVHRDDFVDQVIRFNHNVSKTEVQALFDQVDTDHDSIVTLDEYLAFCERCPALVMTFLDALASGHEELLRSEERTATETLTRENSFISVVDPNEEDPKEDSSTGGLAIVESAPATE